MSRSLRSASDADVATRAAQGDRDAFGELYDRFGSQIYDFCARLTGSPDDAADVTHEVYIRASSRLSQLREPERVRAWLFSVARHECYAHTRKRSRTIPKDPMRFGDTLEQSGRTAGGLLESGELVALATAARSGLESDDLALLDLRFRQDLSGNDLAEAAGVAHEHLHKALARAAERFEKSLTAVVLMRHGRKHCAGLAAVAADGAALDPLLRKRVSRHVEGCDECTQRRHALINPSTMSASAATKAAPQVSPPAGLRDAIVSSMAAGVGSSSVGYGWQRNGFPRSIRRRRTLPTVAMVSGLLLVSAGLARENRTQPFRQPTPPPTTAAPTTRPPTTQAPTTLPPTTLTPTTVPATTTTTTTTAPSTTTTSTTTTTKTPTPTTAKAAVPTTVKVRPTTVPTTRKPIRRRATTTVAPKTAPPTSPPTAEPTFAPIVEPTVPPTPGPTVPPTVTTPPVIITTTSPPTQPTTSTVAPTQPTTPPTTPTTVVTTTTRPCVPGQTCPTTPTNPPQTTTTLKPCNPSVICIPLTIPPIIILRTTTTLGPPIIK